MTENKQEQQKQEALKLLGSAAGTLLIPPSTILPFQNLIQDTTKIKQKEAQRMFPQAHPSLFQGAGGSTPLNLIPTSQRDAQARLYNIERFSSAPNLVKNDIYERVKSYPTFLSNKPGAPSPELGSYQQAIANKTIFPEGDIQAITVTPGPNPGRFAQDYAEILADKLGKTLSEFESGREWNTEAAKLARKIDVLSSKVPGAAGYVWGNIDKPQYTYAEGNWGQGQKINQENPSIYVSRINADPSKEAQYLYTGDVLPGGAIKEKSYLTVNPRSKFKQYEDLGPGTGPSWGITESRGSAGDIHFRKDLIGARGELTAGDLQALLAERNLPFAYSVKNLRGANQGPGDILRQNLQQLASAENITESQAIERFARLVPNIGEPATPPTQAVTGTLGKFPVEGQALSPFGSFASKTDLRQIGILPPSDKAVYSPFTINEFDYLATQPTTADSLKRYGAKSIKPVDAYTAPVDPSDVFGEMLKDKLKVEIDRDVLRPQAANKLLNKTVANLIEQSKPIQGLGIGGLTTGAVATAMDPAVIDALAQGNYMQAGTTAALNATIGSVTGGLTAKGLQALQAAGYARPAAMVGSALPLAGGILGGQSLIETGKALNRAYKAQTGKDWVTRNQPAPSVTYTGSTPSVQPRMGKAVLNGVLVDVPYGSVAGTKTVGRPWWDQAGSRLQKFADLLNRGSVIGR